jgi:hypothetical protein
METEGQCRCRECRVEIVCGARKCVACGSFQDWRRWIQFGDASVAMVISIIALIASLGAYAEKASDTLAEYLELSGFPVGFSIVSMGVDTAKIIGVSKFDKYFLPKDMYCQIWLESNASSCSLARTGMLDSSDFDFRNCEIYGQFIISYDAVDFVPVGARGEFFTEFKVKHISVPGAQPAIGSRPSAGGMCMLSAVALEKGRTGAIIEIDSGDVTAFDLLAMLRNADFSGAQPLTKEYLINRVLTQRSQDGNGEKAVKE